MRVFCPYLSAEVELTDERERHIRETTERAREEWRVYLERALVGAQVDKWAQVASELGAEGW